MCILDTLHSVSISKGTWRHGNSSCITDPLWGESQEHVSISDQMSYRTISWRLETMKFVVWIIWSLWNVTATSAAWCQCACQISKRCNNLNYQSRGFETSRDLTIRWIPLTKGWWWGALMFLLLFVMITRWGEVSGSIMDLVAAIYPINHTMWEIIVFDRSH